MKILFLFLAIGALTFQVNADSPLTSTSLHKGYESSPLVKKALESNQISREQVEFLKGTSALPEKLAIISALGWGDHAQGNCDAIRESMMKGKDSLAQLSQDNLLVLAYAQAIGDYFDMQKTRQYIDLVDFEAEKRESAFWVITLIICQFLLDDQSKWCEIYQRGDLMRTTTELERDMNPVTVNEGIFSYLDIYKDTCSE
ncbi:MAG: hypothetical protein ACO1O6_02445 [Bacteroidota bacterium]